MVEAGETLGKIASLRYYWPELTLAITVLMLLTVDFFVRSKKRLPVVSIFAFLGSFISLFFCFKQMVMPSRNLFDRMVIHDSFSLFFKMIILLATLVIIFISAKDDETNRMNQGEYFALLISMALGAFVLASSTNLLMVYLSLELVSLVSYVLAGYLKKDQRSSEASMKYVIYGGVSSGAMIYGMSFLYGLTGSLEFGAIATSLQQMDLTPALSLALFVSSLFCLAGFGYKIACVPFHMWCPDVYEGSPTPVTAYFSIVPKVAGFAALARFFYGALSIPGEQAGTWVPIFNIEWPLMLAVISVATMTLGNLVAFHQNSLKRLLAYSSIAHAGYILMAFVVLTQEALMAMLFYLSVYFFMNMGAFLVVIYVKNTTGSDQIEQFKGLGWQGGWATFLAISMAIFLFSLTGLPPTAGFIGKVYLFAAVIHEKWYWLALAGVLNSVISLYYYARVIKKMFFEEATKEVASRFSLGYRLPYAQAGLLAILVFFTLLFGIYWSPLVNHTAQSVAFLGRF